MSLTSKFTLPVTPTLAGGAFLGLGLLRFFAPQKAYSTFGLPFPPPLPQKAAPEPSPFLYANGGRELTLGIAFLIFAAQGNSAAVRGLIAASVVTAQVDAYVVWAYGGPQYGGWHGKWTGHSIGGALFGLLAWGGWGI